MHDLSKLFLLQYTLPKTLSTLICNFVSTIMIGYGKSNMGLIPLSSTAQSRYPQILYQGDASHRELALTFDDGPHPRDTPRLLDVLAKHRVRATFHLVGKHAEHHTDLVQQIHAHGHQLALHCYRHIPFPLERPATLRDGLARTQNILATAAGISPSSIRDLRPPYGLLTARTLSWLAAWGYRPVLWSCIPPHWMQPVRRSIRQVLESARPGAVIVLHDGHGHGGKAAEIVEAVVPHIQSLGLEFVTVEQMQARRGRRMADLHEVEEKKECS